MVIKKKGGWIWKEFVKSLIWWLRIAGVTPVGVTARRLKPKSIPYAKNAGIGLMIVYVKRIEIFLGTR